MPHAKPYSDADKNIINLLVGLTPEQAQELRARMLPVLWNLREQILAPKHNGTSREKAKRQITQRLWEVSDKPAQEIEAELAQGLMMGQDPEDIHTVALATQLVVNSLLWDQGTEKNST